MNRMVVHSRVGADGILNIALPIGKTDADREVQVTIDPVATPPMTQEAWRNFVLSTAQHHGSYVRAPRTRPI